MEEVDYPPVKSSYLDSYLHDNVVMTIEDVNDQPSTSGQVDPQPFRPEGGLEAYSNHPRYLKVLEWDIAVLKLKFCIQDPYHVV